jgi:hypothetical protein
VKNRTRLQNVIPAKAVEKFSWSADFQSAKIVMLHETMRARMPAIQLEKIRFRNLSKAVCTDTIC